MNRLIGLALLLAPLCAQGQPRIDAVRQHGGGAVSQGALASILGKNFASLPRVIVGGLNATVYSYSPTDIQIQIPFGAPVGSAPVVVTTSDGTSDSFPLTLVAVSPVIVGIGPGYPIPIAYTYLSQPDCCLPNPFPAPGDVAWMYVNGLGPALISPVPKLFIDNQEYPVLGTRTGIRGFGGETGSVCGPGSAGPFCAAPVPVLSFKVPGLQPGHHKLLIQSGGVNSGTVPLDLIYSGIITSQSGLTFNAVERGPAPREQVFSVLSGIGTIDFNLAVSTVSGGNWLSVDRRTGSAQVGQVGVPVKVTVDPTGLAVGAYYGLIEVSANSVLNSPQSVTVVLRVAPSGTSIGPYLDTTGLIFVGTQGGSDPPLQTVTISNPSSRNLTMAGASGTINQFSFSASTLFSSTVTIPPGQSASLIAQATVKGAAPGTYSARIDLTFSDGSRTAITLLLVVVSNTPPKNGALLAAGGCAPTKLLPVFQLPGASFSVAAGWPTPIQVSVVDDCAVPLTSGIVSVSFSNGDPVLPLLSLRNGTFAGTWAAVRPVAGVTITATASDPASALSARASVAVGVSLNPDVPIISKGGVVDAASNGPALSPGSLVTVYGAKLSAKAGSADGLPWLSTLNNTTVVMGGKPLPLYFTSDGQVNAMIPYNVESNTSQQLVARNGNALSSPQPVLIVPARPGVFVMDAKGQGAIVGSTGLANASAPVKPGDVVVVYCTGLGAVNPPVQSGVAASLTTLSEAVNPVTATVGGRTAAVLFAGVTPGFSGLYQVNLTVPAGLPDNDATALMLSANGQDSVPVTFAVRTPR